ncbi:hypothetical protein LEMLEM_LOCUS18695 [Lemmus lemmus]
MPFRFKGHSPENGQARLSGLGHLHSLGQAPLLRRARRCPGDSPWPGHWWWSQPLAPK